MRSHIFTERERKIINSFIDGKIPLTNRQLTHIRTKIREPELLSDVKLLFSLRNRVDSAMTEIPLRRRGLD